MTTRGRGRPKGSKNNLKSVPRIMNLENQEAKGIYLSEREDSFESVKDIERKELTKARIQIEEGSMPTNLTFEDFHEEALRRSEFREKVEGEKRHVEISIETDKPIAIAFLSDLHVGNSGIDYDLLKETGEIIKEHPLAYCITGGDITDSLFFDYGEEILNMQEQYVYMSKLLNWIGSENILAGILGNHECMDEETEACTRSGWKRFDELTEDDEFLTIGRSGVISWQKPSKIIIEDFNGQLNRFTGQNIDMFVTDNHKVAMIGRRDRVIQRIEASEVAKTKPFDYKEFILTGKNKGKEYPIEDCWIRLSAWIMTDGWINKTSCGISQRVQKAHLPREVLKECGITFVERERKRSTTSIMGKILKSVSPSIEFGINADGRRLIGKYLDNGKYELPNWVWSLSKRQFDIFLGSLIDADGSRKTTTAKCFYQKNKELIDDLQILCGMNGYRTTIYQYYGNQYRLNICERDSIRAVSMNIKKEEYVGKIWDITVPNHIFFVRRNGKAYFTGNSWSRKQGVTNYIEFTNHLQRPLLRGVSFVDLKVGKIPYRLMMAHRFRGESMYNPNHQENRANRELQGADVIMAAHTHKPGESFIYQPEYGGGARKVALVNGKTFKKLDAYGKDQGYIPITGQQLGCNWIILNNDRKMVRIASSNEEMVETMKGYV
jgi:hypothetical protein